MFEYLEREDIVKCKYLNKIKKQNDDRELYDK